MLIPDFRCPSKSYFFVEVTPVAIFVPLQQQCGIRGRLLQPFHGPGRGDGPPPLFPAFDAIPLPGRRLRWSEAGMDSSDGYDERRRNEKLVGTLSGYTE